MKRVSAATETLGLGDFGPVRPRGLAGFGLALLCLLACPLGARAQTSAVVIGWADGCVAQTGRDAAIQPWQIVANAGALLFTQPGKYSVCRWQLHGELTRYAGNSKQATTPGQGDGGMAPDALLFGPIGIETQATDTYISDVNTIRVVQDGGTITTAVNTGLYNPYGMAKSRDGSRLYVADQQHQQLVSYALPCYGAATCGPRVVVAGTGMQGSAGDGGSALSAQLFNPDDVAVCPDGAIYIATEDNRIRRIDPVTGKISTYAGGGAPASGIGDGGPATSAKLNYSPGIACDDHGNLFIADQKNNRARRVDAVTKIITTVAGDGTTGTAKHVETGNATTQPCGGPTDVTVDGDLLFVACSQPPNAMILEVQMGAAPPTATMVAATSTIPPTNSPAPALTATRTFASTNTPAPTSTRTLPPTMTASATVTATATATRTIRKCGTGETPECVL